MIEMQNHNLPQTYYNIIFMYYVICIIIIYLYSIILFFSWSIINRVCVWGTMWIIR